MTFDRSIMNATGNATFLTSELLRDYDAFVEDIPLPLKVQPYRRITQRDPAHLITGFGGGLIEDEENNGYPNLFTLERSVGAVCAYNCLSRWFDNEPTGAGQLFFSGAADKRALVVDKTEAYAMMSTAVALGVDEKAIAIDEEATSTIDNIIMLDKFLRSGPQQYSTIDVITHGFCRARTETGMNRVFKGDQLRINYTELDHQAAIRIDPTLTKYLKRERIRRVATYALTMGLGATPAQELSKRQTMMRSSRDTVKRIMSRQ